MDGDCQRAPRAQAPPHSGLFVSVCASGPTSARGRTSSTPLSSWGKQCLCSSSNKPTAPSLLPAPCFPLRQPRAQWGRGGGRGQQGLFSRGLALPEPHHPEYGSRIGSAPFPLEPLKRVWRGWPVGRGLAWEEFPSPQGPEVAVATPP